MAMYVKDLYWILKSKLSMNSVKKHFTLTLSDDDHEEVVMDVYKIKEIRGETHVGLPRGRADLVRKCLLNPRDFDRIKDRRTDAPVKIPLKFLGDYLPYQEPAFTALASHENGVLKSMPRTGKCLDGNSILCTNHGMYRIKDFPIKLNTTLHDLRSQESWVKPDLTSVTVGAYPAYQHTVRACYHSFAETFEVQTDTGYTVTCTIDERLNVNNQWIPVKDLQPGDKLTIQQNSFWRNVDSPCEGLPAEYVESNGVSLNNALALLIGYSHSMNLVSSYDNFVVVQMHKNVSCFRHAAHLAYKFGGGFYEDDIKLPNWLWNFLSSLEKDQIPAVILRSRKSQITSYLRAYYESTNFDLTRPLVIRARSIGLAKDLQVVLANYPIYVRRSHSNLYADPANTKRFFELLDIRNKEHHICWDCKVEPKPLVTRVTEIVPRGVQPVYDLSVGTNNALSWHFYANAISVHNTVMGTAAIIKTQQKTLILAHQTDLIQQFCNETINDPNQNLYNGATLKEPVAGICHKYDDFLKYDICLATYQTFISDNGQKLLDRIKDMFGVVLIDEVHRAPADRYSQVLSKFSARYMWGLTATDDRKDGRYMLSELIVGPVVHKVKAKSMSAKVYGIKTGIKSTHKHKTWQGAVDWLFKNEERNLRIARTAVRDVKRGHIVLIPVIRHEQAITLKRMIDNLAGRDITFAFTGKIPKAKRQWARDQMNKNSKIKVVVAMRSMLTGLNVPRWSAIYTQAPISNEPNYTQEVFRVCTPMEGKRTPIVRYFFDENISISHGCLRTCCKTLLNPEYAHQPDETFLELTRGSKVQPRESIDEFSVHKGASKVIRRF